MSMRATQAVEEGEEQNAEPSADNRTDEEVQIKQRRRPDQQSPLRDCQYELVKMEENENQAEAADGVFGVDPRAHRRGKITNERFCDAVEADGIIVAERVLKDADRRPQKK